jgi:C1A family cysteine protease
VYASFESAAVAKSGVVNMPKSGEQRIGGHAVMAVGYDDSKRTFLVRNSWGKKWGKKGYFTMPYSYLTSPKLASDFWTVRSVDEGARISKPKKRARRKQTKQ